MTKQKEKIEISDVMEKARAYIESEDDINSILKAYKLAEDKHDGQYRKSGEPYIIHPLNVALILTTIYADASTIEAGLLHDVLEDCDCSEEEMIDIVGSEVTKIVQGVTKLSKKLFFNFYTP